MPQNQTKRKPPFRTAQFHVGDGPAVLFERVQFKLKDSRVLKFQHPRHHQLALDYGLIDQIINFDPWAWSLVSAVVREDSGKFIKSGWVRSFGSRTWFILVGFDVVEELCDATLANIRSTYFGACPLRDKVETVNAELMAADAGHEFLKRQQGRSSRQKMDRRAVLQSHPALPLPHSIKLPMIDLEAVLGFRSFEIEVNRMNRKLQQAVTKANSELAHLVGLLLSAADLFKAGSQALAQARVDLNKSDLQLSSRDKRRLAHAQNALGELQAHWTEVCQRAFGLITRKQLSETLREHHATLLEDKYKCLKEVNDPRTISYLKRLSKLMRRAARQQQKKAVSGVPTGSKKAKKVAWHAISPTPLNWEDASQRIQGKATSGGASRAWAKLRNSGSGGGAIVAASSRRFGK